MIFSFLSVATLTMFSSSGNISYWINTDANLKISSSEVNRNIGTKYLKSVQTESLEYQINQVEFLDLNQDGEKEKIMIRSTIGKEIGEEHTKIYINDNERPILNLKGYFDKFEVHAVNPQGKKILQVSTASGHSISTNFYYYERGELFIIPVSAAKPPSYYGIEARNRPELKDVDGDGVLEMLAYYRHFPPQKQRTVEAYKFNGKAFIKTQEYVEVMTEIYL